MGTPTPHVRRVNGGVPSSVLRRTANMQAALTVLSLLLCGCVAQMPKPMIARATQPTPPSVVPKVGDVKAPSQEASVLHQGSKAAAFLQMTGNTPEETAKDIRKLMLEHEQKVAATNNKFADKLLDLKQRQQQVLGRPYPKDSNDKGVASIVGNTLFGSIKPHVLPPFTAGLNELGMGTTANFQDILPRTPSTALPERAFVYGPAPDPKGITPKMLKNSGAQRLKDHISMDDE